MQKSHSTQILFVLLILLLTPGTAFGGLTGQMTVSANSPEAPYYLYIPMLELSKPPYYVSPQGNDSNPGTFSQPWRTINKAANTVSPGDQVYLRGGTYIEYVTIARSGTQGKPIQFYAYPGETPVMDGQNKLPNSEDGLLTIDGNWVEIYGLEVTNSAYIGIALYGQHNTLTDVYVHHSWRNGVYLNGDFNTIQDSRVWRNSMRSEYGAASGSSGIAASRDSVNGVTEHAMIRGNEIWENWGQGINVHNADQVNIEENISHDNYTANIYIHDISNVLCQSNLIYMDANNAYMGNLGPKVGIMMGEEYSPPVAMNIRVINNFAYGNHRNLFWYTGDMGGGMTNVLFANNTFVNGSGDASNGNSNVILDPAVNVNVRFVNNIVAQDNALPVIDTVVQAGVTYSHNLWSKNPINAVRGSGDVIGDPGLVKSGSAYSAEWYRLLGTSPGINAALLMSEVPRDYFGDARGTAPDMGAAEFIP